MKRSLSKKRVETKSALQKRKDNPRSGYWKKKADAAWGEYMHKRFDSCAICRKKTNLEAHHLISRSNVLTRHLPINGIILCSNHHKFDVQISAHKGPIGFSNWMIDNRKEQVDFVTQNRFKTGEKAHYEASFIYLTELIEELDRIRLVN